MSEAIEKYISDARKSGMEDARIKEMLEKAGWLPEQIDPIITAVSSKAEQPATAEDDPKQHFSIRKLPDLFVDYVWNKIL